MSYFSSVKLIDNNGVPFGLKNVNGKIRVSNQPYLYDIAEGNIPDHKIIYLNGISTNINNTIIDLWTNNTIYTFPTSAMRMEIVSSSANDSASGTGIRTINIHYLDNTYVEQEEIITLNGTTPVNTVATNILRIQKMHTTTVGSGGYAAGVIHLRHLSDTPIYEAISPGYNKSSSLKYTVPYGKVFYIVGVVVGSGSSTGLHYVNAILKVTMDDDVLLPGVFIEKASILTQDNSIYIDISTPIKLIATSDLKISVVSDATSAGSICSVSIYGWLENE